MAKIFKLLFLISVFTVSYNHSFSQHGLEGIIIEKYYISTSEDNAHPELSGELTPGSTTYRIYVDLKPGYTFQMAFGAPMLMKHLFFQEQLTKYHQLSL